MTTYTPINDAGVGMVDKTLLDANFASMDAAISTGDGSAVQAAQADATQALSDAAAAQSTADAALPKAGGTMTGAIVLSSAAAVTAHAGGGRSSATALTKAVSVITVVGTAADSVVLPAAAVGAFMVVINADSADAAQVFANGSDTINGTAGATGISLDAGKMAILFGTSGAWYGPVTS